jgi:DNA-directed RNA polymerase specialized sigma24 family protein
MQALSLDLIAAMTGVTARPSPRPYVDFARVPIAQWHIHDRLENWARWCRGGSGQAARMERCAPMFTLYRSAPAARRYGEETAVPVDKLDAQAVAKAVALLPSKHRRAIHWHYLNGRNPSAAARELGVSLQGLCDLVSNGRQMLVNRGV